MNWIDYCILAIIGFSTLVSVWRGFAREALSLMAWVLAAWMAMRFSGELAGMLENMIEASTPRLIVAFVLLFFATLLAVALVNILILKTIQTTGLSGTDRVLGIFFGIARGIVVVAALVMVGGLTAMPGDSWWDDSLFLHYFEDAALWMKEYLPEDVAESIDFVEADEAGADESQEREE